MKIYLDGEYYDKEDAKISVFDHGLLYGDGVFEGIRFYHRKVFRLTEHIDRLYDSAKAICLQVPQRRSALIDAILETIRKNELHDGYVRLVVTRGSGDLGLNPALCPGNCLHHCLQDHTLSGADVSRRPPCCDLRNAAHPARSVKPDGQIS
jgi:branched-chain amino acid aminotransferase